MGHYDDCYAFDDYSKMDSSSKSSYISRFEKELKENGYTGAYFDDVGGYLLNEYSKDRKDLIVERGYKDILVKTKEFAKKEKEERKAAQLKRKQGSGCAS